MHKMASIQMDLPSANRFVSSLSKSLQALCHGCMDFDTEIEIVGYINVNIDCGSKVDYVLNEKVSKSTNNSMTFISNSFLAKKEQPKTSKDRSCSPISELNVRGRGVTSSELYKSSGIYSPHSQVVRGSQKRSWAGGDWRSAPRKSLKGVRSQYDSYDNQSYSDPSYSSHQTSSFPKQSTSHEYNSSVIQSDVYIKTEVDQSKEDNSFQSNVSAEGNTVPDNTLCDINIKADPDSSDTQDNKAAVFSNTDSSAQKTNNSVQEESQDTLGSESFLKNENSDSTSYGDQASENITAEPESIPSTSQGLPEPPDQESFEVESLPQSLFAGEESGDGDQFDVIEIDDEDEDITAFSGFRHLLSAVRQQKKTNAQMCREYRARLKVTDPDRWADMQAKGKERSRLYRSRNLTDEELKNKREYDRLRSIKYRSKRRHQKQPSLTFTPKPKPLRRWKLDD